MQNNINQNGNIIEEYEPFEEVSLRDYLRIILVRKWIVLAAFLAVIISSVFYIQTTEPVYEAKALLMRNTTQENIPVNILDLKNPNLFSEEWDESSEFLLKSSSFISKIQKRLHENYNIILTTEKIEKNISFERPRDASKIVNLVANANTAEQAQALANTAANIYIKSMTEMKNADLNQGLEFLEAQMNEADKKITETEKKLSEFREREGLFLTSETDSGQNAGLLEQLGNMQSELMQTEYEIEFTRSQLNTINKKISEKKQDANFSSNMLSSPQIDKLQEKLMELQLELTTKLETLTEKDPEIIALQQQINAAKKQLQEEFEKIRENSGITSWDPVSELQSLIQQSISLDLKLNGLEQQATLMEKRIEEFKAKHPEIASKQVEYIRLQRQARVLEQNYTELMNKYEEMRLLEQMKTSELEIIDKASLPEAPIEPRKKLVLLLGGVLGVMLGLGAAFFLEYLDDSIKLKEDVERYLNLPIMGTIPAYKGFDVPEGELIKHKHKAISNEVSSRVLESRDNSSREEDNQKSKDNSGRVRKSKRKNGYKKKIEGLMSHSILYADKDNSSHITENFQTLSANIRYANIDNPIKSLLVTSSGPGEGKSTVVNNLGIIMAKSGMKVIIVDADLRRPRQHRIFQQEKSPGITDFLTQELETGGEQQLKTSILSNGGMIRATPIDNLHLLPAGSQVSNPGLLMDSEKIRELIRDLTEEYDIVLVDSPPVLSVADSVILSNEIESTLLVIRSGGTKQDMATQAKESLEKVDADILGVVLNNVDYSKQYGSYYYYYRYYGYNYYQESEDEEEG